MKPLFKVVIPAYNASAYIERCFQSLERQKERNFEVCVIDDASTEELQKEIIHRYCQRNGWEMIFASENVGPTGSIVKGVKALNLGDDDIFVELDGDDWLFGDHVFGRLSQSYANGALATVGSALRLNDSVPLPVRPYPKEIIKKKLLRTYPFALDHLRSCKGILWRYLRDEDLRDEQGDYWRTGGDCPMMLAICELAGNRLVHVPDILYVYNNQNPINDAKKNRVAQVAVELKARQISPYPSLEEIQSGKAPEFSFSVSQRLEKTADQIKSHPNTVATASPSQP